MEGIQVPVTDYVKARVQEALMRLLLAIASFYVSKVSPWYLVVIYFLAACLITRQNRYLTQLDDFKEELKDLKPESDVLADDDLAAQRTRQVPAYLLCAINKLLGFFWEDSKDTIAQFLKSEVIPWLKAKQLLSKICPIDDCTEVEINAGKRPIDVLEIKEGQVNGRKAFTVFASFRGLDDYMLFQKSFEKKYSMSEFSIRNLRICFEIGTHPSIYLTETPKISWILRREDVLGTTSSEHFRAEDCIENLVELTNEFLAKSRFFRF